MELIRNHGLATATTITKQEEMPYTGKSVTEGSEKDKNGMAVEGGSGIMGTGPNRGNVSNVYSVR